MTPTERLREAARVLRERINATTWIPECGGWWVPDLYTVAEADQDVLSAVHDSGQGAVKYAATMHPGVGLALADWLDSAAHDDEMVGADYHAFAVADLILGGGERR